MTAAAIILLVLASTGLASIVYFAASRLAGDKLELAIEEGGQRVAVMLYGDAATITRRGMQMLRLQIAALRAELAQERGE